MYRLSRLILIVAFLAGVYSLVIVGIIITELLPWAPFAAMLVLFIRAKSIRKKWTTLGSARFATREELQRQGMLNTRYGLIIGRLP